MLSKRIQGKYHSLSFRDVIKIPLASFVSLCTLQHWADYWCADIFPSEIFPFLSNQNGNLPSKNNEWKCSLLKEWISEKWKSTEIGAKICIFIPFGRPKGHREIFGDHSNFTLIYSSEILSFKELNIFTCCRYRTLHVFSVILHDENLIVSEW